MVYFLVIACIFTADLLIKNRVEKTEKVGETRKIFSGRLLLRRHHNKGFVLNKGSGRQWFVAVCSLVLVLLCTVCFMVSLGNRGNTLLRTGLAILLGGAYNNTYDRLKRKYVVDYISFPVKWKRFSDIVFNLSDFCIAAGAFLCCLAETKKM